MAVSHPKFRAAAVQAAPVFLDLEASISKAIQGAVAKAGSTLRHMGWFEVTEIRGHIKGDEVDSYQVTIKAGFKLED